MLITLVEGERTEQMAAEALVAAAPIHVELDDRVPGVSGKAFELIAWYEVWTTAEAAYRPTHLYVEATDEFTAMIPWNELENAVFLYEQNGAPIQKGFPLRLYVPDGSSACLNVKSVIRIEWHREREPGEKAVYGYKNQIMTSDLKKRP